MTQERKWPVKENAYKTVVRPMARLALFVMFVAAAMGIGFLIGRSPFDHSAGIFLRFGVAAVFWGAVFCSLAVWFKATEWSLQKRLRAVAPFLFCLIMFLLILAGTLWNQLNWFALVGCLFVGIAALVLVSEVFLAPQIWQLFRALDVPMFADKDDDAS